MNELAKIQAQIRLADKLLKNTDKSSRNIDKFAKTVDQFTKNANIISKNIDRLSIKQEKTDERIDRIAISQEKTHKQIQKSRANQEKTDERIDRIAISQEKTDKQIQEFRASQEKTDQMIQKVGGRFNERWGHLVESLVKGKLVPLFQEQNIDVTEIHENSVGTWRIPGAEPKTREIDILVANGTEAVAVEVKTTLNKGDIDDFLETLRDFKRYFKRFNNETIYGAMAFLKAEGKAHLKAEEKGLFIISATGDSARLVNKKGFKPKAFCQ